VSGSPDGNDERSVRAELDKVKDMLK